jgi:hypothetical protein
MDDKDKLILEAFVDRYSVPIVIDALSEICFDKAAHIAENFQDMELSKAWIKTGDALAQFKGTQRRRVRPAKGDDR